jgi:hypothetical protein
MSTLDDVLWGLLIYDMATMGVNVDRDAAVAFLWALLGAVAGVLLVEVLFRQEIAATTPAGEPPADLQEEVADVESSRADGSPGAHSVTPEREQEAED